MGKFDAALKHTIAAFPADWAHFLGVPKGVAVEAVDTDLSVVSQAADKLLRIATDPPSLMHLEPHAWHDTDFDDRVLLYHSTIRRRERLPVHSVAFILHPNAWRSDNRGGVCHVSSFGGCQIDFKYQVIKVWELPVETFLEAGPGMLILAPLANVTTEQLPSVIDTMTARLSQEVPRADAAELWTATHLVMGLKYTPDVTELMLRKVRSIMQESPTYQAILREGREEGKRETLLLLGERQFGPPSDVVRQRIQSAHDPAVLDSLLLRILEVESWDELLGASGG